MYIRLLFILSQWQPQFHKHDVIGPSVILRGRLQQANYVCIWQET